jgi:hypothetical protein
MVKWLTTLGEIFLGIGIFVMFVTSGIPTEYIALLIIISGVLIILSYYISKRSEEAGRVIAVVCVALVLAAIFAPVYTYGSRWAESGWEWEEEFPFSSERISSESLTYFEPKDTIYIKNINGRIEVEPWDDDQIRLEWIKYAPNEDFLDRIEIEIEESPGRLEVKTYLPTAPFSFGNRRVDYKLFLPDKRINKLNLHSTNGKISIEDVDQVSRIEVRTTNGKIEMEEIDTTSADIHTTNAKIVIEDSRVREMFTHTTNGKIEVSLLDMGNVSLETPNGKIYLSIPEYRNFRIDARTTNGDVEFEPEVALIIDKVSRNKFIGHVDPILYELELKTTNGDITIA